MKLLNIKAVFMGRDGSCGFRTGKEYDLWMFERNDKIYISRRDMDAMAIPYDTMAAVRKNWSIRGDNDG